MVERLHREEMERLKKKEEDEAAEIKRLQELDQELAHQKMEDDVRNRLKEKQARERRELERVQREQYTKQLKNSIMSGLENQTEAKKKVLSIRDKTTEDRLEQTRRERDRFMAQKREEKETRLAKAREDLNKMDEEERNDVSIYGISDILGIDAAFTNYVLCIAFLYSLLPQLLQLLPL